MILGPRFGLHHRLKVPDCRKPFVLTCGAHPLVMRSVRARCAWKQPSNRMGLSSQSIRVPLVGMIRTRWPHCEPASWWTISSAACWVAPERNNSDDHGGLERRATAVFSLGRWSGQPAAARWFSWWCVELDRLFVCRPSTETAL